MLKTGKTKKEKEKLASLISELEKNQSSSSLPLTQLMKKVPGKKAVEKKMIRHQKEMRHYENGVKATLEENFEMAEHRKRLQMY